MPEQQNANILAALEASRSERTHRAAALAAAADRRAAVLAAHEDGLTWKEIARAIGVTTARAEALARHRTDVATRRALR